MDFALVWTISYSGRKSAGMDEDLFSASVGGRNAPCEFTYAGQDLAVRRDIAAEAAEEFDRTCSIQSEANIFDELAGAHLDHQKNLGSIGKFAEVRGWERIERDGAQNADFDSLGARFGGHGFENAADDAIADENDLGIGGEGLFGASFALFGAEVLGFEIANVGFEFIGIEMKRSDEVGA